MGRPHTYTHTLAHWPSTSHRQRWLCGISKCIFLSPIFRGRSNNSLSLAGRRASFYLRRGRRNRRRVRRRHFYRQDAPLLYCVSVQVRECVGSVGVYARLGRSSAHFPFTVTVSGRESTPRRGEITLSPCAISGSRWVVGWWWGWKRAVLALPSFLLE